MPSFPGLVIVSPGSGFTPEFLGNRLTDLGKQSDLGRFINGQPVNSLNRNPVTTPEGKLNPDSLPQPEPQPQKTKTKEKCQDPCISDLQDQAGTENIQVPIVTCSNGEAKTEAVTIAVAKGTGSGIKRIFEEFAKQAREACENPPTVTVPEWWQKRPEADRPQLVVTMAEQLGTGKLTTSRWSLTIPHYNRPKGFKPNIPTHNRGDFEGILTLRDNSKIIVHCSTATEAKRVLNALKILVDVRQRTSEDGKALPSRIGERVGYGFKKCRVVAIRGDFYAQGLRSTLPDWRVDLRKK